MSQAMWTGNVDEGLNTSEGEGRWEGSPQVQVPDKQ